MNKQATIGILVAVLVAAPFVGLEASQTQPKTTTKHASGSAPATHATKGVVKSVDATTLVITRADKKHSEMKFALDTSTQRPEGVAIGAPVSVRYREDGKTHVATAVTVQPSKQAAQHTTASKG
jgi:hypothetical protein